MVLGADPSAYWQDWHHGLVGAGLFAGLSLVSTQTPEPGFIALLVLDSVFLWRWHKKQAVPCGNPGAFVPYNYPTIYRHGSVRPRTATDKTV